MFTANLIASALSDRKRLSLVDASALALAVEMYPYSEPLHRLFLRKLSLDNPQLLPDAINQSAVHIANRRFLHNYLFKPDRMPLSDLDAYALSGIANDYFAATEKPEQRASLQELAAKLKAVRIQKQAQITAQTPLPENLVEVEATEENVMSALKENKYDVALQILNALCLKKPKKSVYFAAQINYVKTIIENSK
ncbi:MAG: hypothetical protein LBS16_07075 [Prevotellaceae bacterium]|nr:hypothetical protein [Prevotellaceae bacterium]